MAAILWRPSPERRVSTNVWAFLHWLAMTRGIALTDWGALALWSEAYPAAFTDALQAFAGPGSPAELAAWLLFLDLRPDDRVLAFAPFAGLPLSPAPATTAALSSAAAEHKATVLIAPSRLLAAASALTRLDRAPLRTLLAIGGPMSPAARTRVYSNVKSDVLLLAAASDRVWGDPLGPVLASPRATLTLAAKPPPSIRDAP